ncbi:YraN family protein [Plantactinospora sp. KBS50]|uniref:YraN family protein n=1 Tax=Plantactinospora sp. KBS50 TaxID=2024580 RepID=UPI000BAAEBF9|nr:YraN family protein [Plantactinospora sp. KBS50]ASW54022.1 YraN family protein [Plantactinospora sp. KBS50]
MTMTRLAVGAYGERCAVRHLIEAEMRVVARNWRCDQGEIDIIAWERDVLAFCEVKSRRGGAYGWPGEAVTAAKVRRLRRLALRWLRESGTHPREIRFDVLEVYVARTGGALVEHIRAAF